MIPRILIWILAFPWFLVTFVGMWLWHLVF